MWILLEQVTDISAAELKQMHLNAGAIPITIDPGDGKIAVLVAFSSDFLPGSIPFNTTAAVYGNYLQGNGASAFEASAFPFNATVREFASGPGVNLASDLTNCVGMVYAFLDGPITTGNGTLRLTTKYYVHDLQ